MQEISGYGLVEKDPAAVAENQFAPGVSGLWLNYERQKAWIDIFLTTTTGLLVKELSIPIMKRTVGDIMLPAPGLLRRTTLLPAADVIKHDLLPGFRHAVHFETKVCTTLCAYNVGCPVGYQKANVNIFKLKRAVRLKNICMFKVEILVDKNLKLSHQILAKAGYISHQTLFFMLIT